MLASAVVGSGVLDSCTFWCPGNDRVTWAPNVLDVVSPTQAGPE